MQQNVIPLFPRKSVSFDCAAVNRRAASRSRAPQRRRDLLTAVEALVTILIGAGFTFCIALTIAML